MKSMKSALLALALLMTAQVSYAEFSFVNPPKCNGTSILYTDHINKNDKSIPDFMKKSPVILSDGSTTLTLGTYKRTIKIKGTAGDEPWVAKYLFRGKVNNFMVGTLYIGQICISGSSFRITLENYQQYNAQLSGNSLIFEGKHLTPR